MTQEIHYFRNKLNRVPKTLSEMKAINEDLPNNEKWLLMGIDMSVYHIFGDTGVYNLKFVSGNDGGMYEAVYDKNGNLVVDPVNMGTFNYGTPEWFYDDLLPADHYIYDVHTYEKWGNVSRNDLLSKDERSQNILRYQNDPNAVKYREVFEEYWESIGGKIHDAGSGEYAEIQKKFDSLFTECS